MSIVTFNCEPKRTTGQEALGLDSGEENFVTLVNHQGHTEILANPCLGKLKALQIKACQQSIAKAKKGSNHQKALSLGKH